MLDLTELRLLASLVGFLVLLPVARMVERRKLANGGRL